MKLLIVESPAKARKISAMLGKGWWVQASVGHVRDLPIPGEKLPEKYQDVPWAQLGVNVNDNFKTIYVVYKDKKNIIRDLKKLTQDASEVFLATDPDREGESIAWHLKEELGLKNVQRVTYQEITETAIRRALERPRPLDMQLVAAQEARRILDRLVGFAASPKVTSSIGQGARQRKLSAGRVQSATLLILASREHSRMAFTSAEVHEVRTTLAGPPEFQATLTQLQGKVVATTSSYGPDGQLKEDAKEHHLLSKTEAENLAVQLGGKTLTVSSVTKKPISRKPPAPITTSGLQQLGGRLKFNARKISETAQHLYEQGHITYIRTDSPVLSDEAVTKGQALLRSMFGDGCLPDQVRKHTAGGSAQEAHEAIRPTQFTPPEQTGLEGDELKLYRLIFETTLASLMKDAVGEKTDILLEIGTSLFMTSGTVILEPGYLQLFDDQDDQDAANLPNLEVGQRLAVLRAEATTSKSKPPPRFTEPSIIKAIEKAGIGRPSTFTATIETLKSRGYVLNNKNQLHVTPLGLVVAGYLQQQMPTMVNRQFTAEMEQQLDQIAAGKMNAVAYLNRVWKQQLGPQIEAATTTPPKVAVPGFAGAVLSSQNGRIILSVEGKSAALHEDVLSEELVPKNRETLLASQPVGRTRSAASRGSTPRKSRTKKGTRKKA